jgi:hypothetical protein
VTAMLERAGQAGDADAGADAFRMLGPGHDPDLTDEDVRRAYLLRLRAVHPDNGGDTGAAAAVTAAYDAIRSAVRRGELLAAATIDRGDAVPAPPRRRPGRRTARPGARRTGEVPDEARRAELRAKVAASRAAQGLPPYVTDEATLAKIADLLVVMLGRGDGAGKHPRSAGAAWPWHETGSLPPAVPALAVGAGSGWC